MEGCPWCVVSACEIIVMQVGYRHIDYAQLYCNEIEVCVGLGEKREEVGEAVVVGGLGFSSWSVWLAVEKGECRGSKRGR
ncbi:hypothetical protein NC653_038018 [Populus alba x Populus x berolinensis]|uniref:NADP-dependent oxidoreductase domain-containing protein n=1 Tax=Populus alba x Populus x berolinensis TaxID=444605 RepID=A0AAD6PSU5_9ROSI|nr:hypothetical protein NC653_038018 [Populus alba x Populus x berolinensis]